MSQQPPSPETLFAAAMEHADAAERRAFLGAACGSHSALRQEVESLLAASQQAGGFMQNQAAADLLPALPSAEKTGDRIGRYKLLEQVGEGGFGVVWMAEQEEPVRRRVALKIIKLGMDTKEVVARFEAERQALAMMEHPSIAKVFDGGVTGTGRLYFVMELVKGIPITTYCDANKLATGERLELFMQVCHAVQHAHQKGVIHRDLKPSNILVTEQDGAPLPKVIDFGVAKATQARLTERTLFTGLHQMIGTPAYMSPEQAGLGALDLDTRSDIYALGVLLYELLTGQTPFRKEEFQKASLDEIFRLIREQDPPKPSTRLSILTREELTTIATQRQAEPARLNKLIRGELDWIVMKALEKNRQRRYETANGLALDILRHLRNEPVAACPPSPLYRFQKLVRRNKLTFATASAVAAALVTGMGIAAWQFVEKNQAYTRAVAAEQQARTEAKRSRQVAQFLKDMLKSVDPSVALGRDATMLREILDRTAERVGNELKEDPEVEAELRTIIGTTYHELGEWAKAETMHREALRLRRGVYGATNELTAVSLNNLGSALWEQAKKLEAEVAQREALAIRRNLPAGLHPDVTMSLTSLADVLMGIDKFAEAESLLREALARQTAVAGHEGLDVIETLNQLASVLESEGKHEEAETVVRRALELCQKLPAGGHPTTATTLLRLGRVLEAKGDLTGAESMCRKAVEMRRKMLGNDHPYVASALGRFASVLGGAHKFAEAVTQLREALAILEKTAPDDPGVFQTRAWIGHNLWELNQYAEAEPLLLLGYKGLKERENRISGVAKYWLSVAVQDLARLYQATGKPDQAAEWRRKVVEPLRRAAESGEAQALNELAWLLATCSDSQLRDGRSAVTYAEKAVAATNRKDPAILDTLAAAYAESGDFAKAVSVQNEAIALLKDEASKREYASRLQLYESNSPYRAGQ